MVIDYSKWDNVGVSSDEEDSTKDDAAHYEDDLRNTRMQKKPHVTKFEKPSSVTFGGNDGTIEITPSMENSTVLDAFPSAPPKTKPISNLKNRYDNDYSKWNNLEESESEEEVVLPPYEDEMPEEFAPQKRKQDLSNDVKKVAKKKKTITKNKTNEINSSWYKNGDMNERLIWSQTRDNVDVRILVPKDTKGSDVCFEIKFPGEITILEDKIPIVFSLTLKNKLFFKDKLAFDIKPIEDIHDLDWEIYDHPIDSNFRLIFVSVEKEPPSGTYCWWDKIFEGDEKIDVTQMSGRHSDKSRNAWKEAHDKFKEKIKKDKLQGPMGTEVSFPFEDDDAKIDNVLVSETSL